MRVKNQVPRRGMTKKATLTRVLGLWIQWKIPNFHSVHSQRYLSNGKTYLENFSPARQQRTVLKGLLPLTTFVDKVSTKETLSQSNSLLIIFMGNGKFECSG